MLLLIAAEPLNICRKNIFNEKKVRRTVIKLRCDAPFFWFIQIFTTNILVLRTFYIGSRLNYLIMFNLNPPLTCGLRKNGEGKAST